MFNSLITVLLHGQELTLETEPFLLPIREYGTVCLNMLD